MAINYYDLGEDVTCTLVATKVGIPTDPSPCEFIALKPDGTTFIRYVYGVDAQLVKDLVGNYHVILTPDEWGEWRYRFYGGSPKGSGWNKFVVRPEPLV
jgi:hypothetical protein